MAPVSCTNGIGKNYEMADLEVVSYQRLRGKDEIESAKLFNACTESGFFYLDLADPKDKPYCKTVEASFALSKEYFTRPLEEKLNDKREELSALNVCGYVTSFLKSNRRLTRPQLQTARQSRLRRGQH